MANLLAKSIIENIARNMHEERSLSCKSENKLAETDEVLLKDIMYKREEKSTDVQNKKRNDDFNDCYTNESNAHKKKDVIQRKKMTLEEFGEKVSEKR